MKVFTALLMLAAITDHLHEQRGRGGRPVHRCQNLPVLRFSSTYPGLFRVPVERAALLEQRALRRLELRRRAQAVLQYYP